MKTAADVVAADLDHLARALREEFATMAGDRLLIVGGAGFLGHYLVQGALYWNRVGGTAPIAVEVWDNYSRGVPGWLTALEGDANLTLRRHDITQPLPEDIGDFTWVIHAASIASPTYYRKFPIETMDANVDGLRRLLDYALRQKAKGRPLKGFLFYSTSEIYGDPTPDNIPTPETYRGNVSCTGPRACYDESKRYGETLCVNFAEVHGLPIKIARPFNNYGPGLKITDRRVLPDFARDVLEGRDIVMLSDGAPTRTFCYIADAIAGYYKILVRGRAGESYNVGTESPEISMATLAEKVTEIARELWGYEGRVVRRESEDKAYLVDNPNRRCPVIAKAREELGYDPIVGVDDGLRRALIWYGENREAEES
jgi:UDP-glucuronate decarboxylase